MPKDTDTKADEHEEEEVNDSEEESTDDSADDTEEKDADDDSADDSTEDADDSTDDSDEESDETKDQEGEDEEGGGDDEHDANDGDGEHKEEDDEESDETKGEDEIEGLRTDRRAFEIRVENRDATIRYLKGTVDSLREDLETNQRYRTTQGRTIERYQNEARAMRVTLEARRQQYDRLSRKAAKLAVEYRTQEMFLDLLNGRF